MRFIVIGGLLIAVSVLGLRALSNWTGSEAASQIGEKVGHGVRAVTDTLQQKASSAATTEEGSS